jgi:hypothetical protein
MKSSIWTAGLAALVFAGSAFAQSAPVVAGGTATDKVESPGNSLYTQASPFRLFDSARLRFGQSYSLSYFSGGLAGSQSIGVYMSSIGYQIADPLYVQLDLGILHSPGALFGGDARNLNAQFRPNFMLRYSPSNKFNLIVDVRTLSPYSYGGFGYRPDLWSR